MVSRKEHNCHKMHVRHARIHTTRVIAKKPLEAIWQIFFALINEESLSVTSLQRVKKMTELKLQKYST